VARSAHLVGSIPAENADGAMRLALSRVGRHLRFLPDGETGERYHWITNIIESFRHHPDFEVKNGGPCAVFRPRSAYGRRAGRRGVRVLIPASRGVFGREAPRASSGELTCDQAEVWRQSP
jgi:hypothetical protein